MRSKRVPYPRRAHRLESKPPPYEHSQNHGKKDRDGGASFVRVSRLPVCCARKSLHGVNSRHVGSVRSKGFQRFEAAQRGA